MADKYELIVVVSDHFKEADCAKQVESIETLISELGGSVLNKDVWGKKQLAYKINKRSHGFYVLYDIEGPREMVTKLNRRFRISEGIIRHLIVKKDKYAPSFVEINEEVPSTVKAEANKTEAKAETTSSSTPVAEASA